MLGSVDVVLGGSSLFKEMKGIAEGKDLKFEDIASAVEGSLSTVFKRKYSDSIEVKVDRGSGNVIVLYPVPVVEDGDNSEGYRSIKEVEDIEGYDFAETDDYLILPISEAQEIAKDAVVGGQVMYPINVKKIGLVDARLTREELFDRIRFAEREKQYNDFQEHIGTMRSGIVKRIERNGNVIVKIGMAEAMLPARERMERHENFIKDSKIKVYINKVERSNYGYQIFLSRIHPNFIVELMKSAIPEVCDGLVEIKSVVREPGAHAKVAVYASDTSVEPIGACIGLKGCRIQSVIAELSGEKVDIIPYSSDLVNYVVSALSLPEVDRVIIDHDKEEVEVVVADELFSRAIGRGGVNVKLASRMVGWKMLIAKESEYSAKKTVEFNERVEHFCSALNITEMLAQLMATEGYLTVDDIAGSDPASMDIVGLEDCEELCNRAKSYVSAREVLFDKKLQEVGIDIKMKSLELSHDELLKLGELGIKSMEDLADCSSDDLKSELPDNFMNKERVDDIILFARKELKWID